MMKKDLAAAVSSGSFVTDGMVILPLQYENAGRHFSGVCGESPYKGG